MYTYFVSFVLGFSNNPSPSFGNFIFDVTAPITDAGGINSIQQQITASLQPSFTPQIQVSVTLLNIVLLKQTEAQAESTSETATNGEAEGEAGKE